MKRCRKCTVTKPLEEFYPNPVSLDGLKNICRKCENKERVERANGLRPPKPTSKVCSKCNKEKPYEEFRNNRGDVMQQCNLCRFTSHRKIYEHPKCHPAMSRFLMGAGR